MFTVVEVFQFDNSRATLQAKLHMTLLLFVLVIPNHDGMKLKFKCSPLTSFRSTEKQVHAKCPSGALKSSNMYDNSTKQSLLLIGYFSGNAIELYRFGVESVRWILCFPKGHEQLSCAQLGKDCVNRSLLS
ncbi:hypothetical protein T10_8259 [Trichinella papuae]|uniref:Uncharacterized protein n=1 Tax=Trichinella papuae TaxID=268474 RepID=A0A0V1MIW1_9BILA|nr:hypothetical protein T10_8259 [Trichinella papuae]